MMSFGYKCSLRALTKTLYYVPSWLSYNINVTVNILFKASIFPLIGKKNNQSLVFRAD